MFTKTKITLVCLVLSLSLVGCGGDATPAPAAAPTAATTAPTAAPQVTVAPTSVPAPTVAPTTAPAAAAPSGDAKEALLTAMRKQITGGPYRLKTTITSDKGTIEMNGEVNPPDQMRMQMISAGNTTEMVFMGDKGWMKVGDKWQASPISGGEMMKQIMQSVDEFAPHISNVQYVGEESLDGKPAHVYTYRMELGADMGNVKSDAKVWIDSASGRVIKSASTGDVGGAKSTTVQTIEYDANIKIESPIK